MLLNTLRDVILSPYTLHLEISGTYYPLLWCLLVSDIPAEHHMGGVKSVKSWKVFLNTNTLYLVISVTIPTLRFYALLYVHTLLWLIIDVRG